MKAVVALVLVMTVCGVGSASGEVSNVWMRQVGSGSTDYGAGVATDGLGHAYLAGSTLGSFVPGGGTFPFDPYLVKYDSAGNRLWIRQPLTNREWSIEARGVAADPHGNVWMVGFVEDGYDVYDGFILQFNDSGDVLHERYISTSEADSCHAVCADGTGNVYVAGDTEGALPGGGGHHGKSDPFVAKYNDAGQQVWIRQWGGEDLDSGQGICCDIYGNVYVTGYLGTYLGGFKMDYDVFVCKYSPDGTRLWWREFATGASDSGMGMGVACDEQDNLYVTGSTTSDLFGSNTGEEDVFLIKLNTANGGTIWSRQFGTDDEDWARGIATDPFGSVFLTGSTEGNLASANQGFCDLFCCRYNSDGARTWIEQLGTHWFDRNNGVCVDQFNVYFAGESGGLLYAASGDSDAHLHRYVIVPPRTTDGISTDRNKGQDVGDPVSANSGAFHFTLPLLTLGGPLPLEYGIRYRMDQEASTELYPGFQGSTSFLLERLPHDNLTDIVAVVHLRNGEEVEFTRNSTTGQWDLDDASRTRYVLKETGPDYRNGFYYLMDPFHERVYVFEKVTDLSDPFHSPARPLHVMDRNGNRHDYIYADDQQLSPDSIVDNLGRSLDFTTYAADTDQLRRVTDQSGRYVELTRETVASLGDVLRSVRDTMGGDTTFHYTSVTPDTNCAPIVRVDRPRGNSPLSLDVEEVTRDDTNFVRVTAQTDAYGNGVDFSYAAAGTRVDVSGPDGSDVVLEHFHHDGMLSRLTDAAGNVMDFGETANEQQSSVSLNSGATASSTYHAPSGLVAGFRDPDDHECSNAFSETLQTFTCSEDANEVEFTFYNLTRRDYPDSTYETMTYDGHGNLVARRNRAGKTTTYTHNVRGQVLSVTLPSGGIVSNTYNADGTPATSFDPESGTTSFGYDSRKRLNRITDQIGAFRTWTYDDVDRVTSVTDERGNMSEFSYDANGNLTTATDPKNCQTTYTYDLLDRVSSVTDALGNIVNNTYNAVGRPASQTDANGLRTEYGYEARGMLNRITRAGQTWRTEYDAAGNAVSTVTPLGFVTTTERNASGMAVAVTDPEGGRSEMTRDGLHRVSSVTDATGRHRNLARNAWNSLDGLSNAIAHASYARNNFGALSNITDPNGQGWATSRSPFGRLLSLSDPLDNTIGNTYDNAGRLSMTTFADGETVTRSRDAAGNVTALVYGSGLTRSFTYDADVNRIASTDGIAFTYDALGRITATANADGSVCAAAFDSGGRLETATCAGLLTVTYEYNPANLLSRVSDSLSGVQIDFTYDADGRLTGMQRPNGIDTTFQYDDADRLTSIRHGTLVDLRYTLDAAGRIVGMDLDAPLTPADALVSGMRDYTFDAASQLGTTGYAYDQRGHRLTDPARTYDWDAAGRLIAVSDATSTSHMTYNGLSDLVSRVDDGGTNTTYIYNYAIRTKPIVAERDGADGTWKRLYVHTPSGDLLYAIEADSGNAPRYYHFDGMGNTLLLTDGAGAVTDAYAYAPYGQQLAHTGASDQPFTYVGQRGVRREDDAGTLYHMRARYYDAVTTAFVSRDPMDPRLDDIHSLNPYEYARCNPLKYIDPTGTDPQIHTFQQKLWEMFRDLKKFPGRIGVGDALIAWVDVIDLTHTMYTKGAAAAYQQSKYSTGESLVGLFADPSAHNVKRIKHNLDAFNQAVNEAFVRNPGRLMREVERDLQVYDTYMQHAEGVRENVAVGVAAVVEVTGEMLFTGIRSASTLVGGTLQTAGQKFGLWGAPLIGKFVNLARVRKDHQQELQEAIYGYRINNPQEYAEWNQPSAGHGMTPHYSETGR